MFTTLISDPFVLSPTNFQPTAKHIRRRHITRELRKLDTSKATGPYAVGANSILKELAKELSHPLMILCRRILSEACWPEKWRIHNLTPIYKRSSVYKAGNYRGIHVTCNLSKVAERVIGNPLIDYLQKFGFGKAQWAFQRAAGARDLLTVLSAKWIRAICMGRKIGAYFSDIAGAFDRVDKEWLMAKLYNLGVNDTFLDFLNSYLEPRIGRVSVESIFSESFILCNMVYQGTVLGPCLWNAFFNDVHEPASSQGGYASIFADDLNVFKEFDIDFTNSDFPESMQHLSDPTITVSE